MILPVTFAIDAEFFMQCQHETGFDPAILIDYIIKNISDNIEIPVGNEFKKVHISNLQLDNIFLYRGYRYGNSSSFELLKEKIQNLSKLGYNVPIIDFSIPNTTGKMGETGVDSFMQTHILRECLSAFAPKLIIIITGDEDHKLIRSSSIPNSVTPILVRMNWKEIGKYASSNLCNKFTTNVVSIEENLHNFKFLFGTGVKTGQIEFINKSTEISKNWGKIYLPNGIYLEKTFENAPSDIYFHIANSNQDEIFSLNKGDQVQYELLYSFNKEKGKYFFSAKNLKKI